MRTSLSSWGLLSAFFALARSEESGTKTKSWTLYHRAVRAGESEGDWLERGTIDLVVDADAAAEPTITVKNNEDSIPDMIAELSISDSAYYQVKLGDSDDNTILTTVPSCHLRRSNYRDEIVLQLNSRAEPLSIAYMPLVSRLAPAVCADYEGDRPATPQFQSTISFQSAVAGMVVGKPPKVEANKPQQSIKPPPGLKWMGGSPPKRQRARGGGPAGPEEAEEDTMPKGPFAFLQKYWYVLVPMLIMNLVTQQQEEPPPVAQGAQAATAATAGGGAAVAAATGAGATSQRRGKKGKN